MSAVGMSQPPELGKVAGHVSPHVLGYGPNPKHVFTLPEPSEPIHWPNLTELPVWEARPSGTLFRCWPGSPGTRTILQKGTRTPTGQVLPGCGSGLFPLAWAGLWPLATLGMWFCFCFLPKDSSSQS